MASGLKKGDAVAWSSHGGEVHGKVVREITKPMRIKGHTVAASKEEPQLLVETDEGKRAAHKPSALRRD